MSVNIYLYNRYLPANTIRNTHLTGGHEKTTNPFTYIRPVRAERDKKQGQNRLFSAAVQHIIYYHNRISENYCQLLLWETSLYCYQINRSNSGCGDHQLSVDRDDMAMRYAYIHNRT